MKVWKKWKYFIDDLHTKYSAASETYICYTSVINCTGAGKVRLPGEQKSQLTIRDGVLLSLAWILEFWCAIFQEKLIFLVDNIILLLGE